MSDDQNKAASQKRKLRRTRGSGSLFRKGVSRTWVIQYYKDDPATGKRARMREYTGLTSREAAQKLLNTRLYQVDRGELFETRKQSVRIEHLFDALTEHTRNNSRSQRGAKGVGWRWKHLKPIFANMLAANLTTDDVIHYTRKRQEQGAANATINRELATLRRAFNLGKRSSKVRNVPYIPMLKEDNVRRGFVEDVDFSKLAAGATELWLRAFLEMAFTYGWRVSELLGLRVRHVSISNRTIRLDPGTTKNGEGREVRMTPKITELLKLAVSGKRPDDHLLTRDSKNGKPPRPVRDFRAAWASLCIRANLGEFVCRQCGQSLAEQEKCSECGSRKRKYRGLIVHDMRRSAAKAARRAGVPESVIMATGGWKTPAMFRRYAIVSSADQRDFVEKLERARAANISPCSAPFSSEAESAASTSVEQKLQ